MRRLLVVVIVLAALWSGYWVVGAIALERGISAWIDQRRAEGWVAEYSDIAVRGFPNRFDTTLSDVMLADPRTGVAWQAPFFQVLALSYRPNHVIAVWPDEQSIASPFERIGVTSDQMRGSVVFEPGTSLTLDRSTFVLDAFTLTGEDGWEADIRTGRFATKQVPVNENTHDIGFEALGVRPAEALLARLDPSGALPDEVETLKIDARVAFDAPWDRFAIERARPQVTSLDLNLLQANWGRLDLRAAGDLTVDGDGVPTGRITIKATNWREMLEIGRASGVVPDGLYPTLETALDFLAGLSGDDETLDAPLSFQNGFVSFGPIPLGPAPRIRIR